MDELLSVIVPVYNMELYLRQCIESIINQTYKNLEVILVDDGSTDKSSDICDEYAARDNRVKVIHKINGGLVSARKAGILAATGVYVGSVDADDWVESEMYETLHGFAKRSGAAVIESGVIDAYPNAENHRVSFYDEGFYAEKKFADIIAPTLLYTGDFFQQGVFPYIVTKLFKKEILLECQMAVDEISFMGEDASCSYPCIIKTKALYITHQCFYHYRVNYNSLKRTRIENADQIIQKRIYDWEKCFEQTEFWDTLSAQLSYYTMYLLVWKAPAIFDEKKVCECLIPYGGVAKGTKIVLYGAGAVGIQLRNYVIDSNCCNIVYWADKNHKQFSSNEICAPEGIPNIKCDYIIIAILNSKAAQSAKSDLVKLGIPEEKIRWIDQKYLDDPNLLLDRTVI